MNDNPAPEALEPTTEAPKRKRPDLVSWFLHSAALMANPVMLRAFMQARTPSYVPSIKLFRREGAFEAAEAKRARKVIALERQAASWRPFSWRPATDSNQSTNAA